MVSSVRGPRPYRNGIVAAIVLVVAVITVGMTAADDQPFTIAVRPVFLTLGVDVDVKVGALHLHASWSALAPSARSSDAVPLSESPSSGLPVQFARSCQSAKSRVGCSSGLSTKAPSNGL
jgi:hypothetical protein